MIDDLRVVDYIKFNIERKNQTMEEIIVKIVKDDDGDFHVIDHDGAMGAKCKIIEDGRTISLTKNAANRQYCAVAKANAGIEADGFFVLTVRTTEARKLGPAGSKMPNAKLISYLPEELQEEYKALIAKAIAARDAEINRPLTEREKAERALEKAKAQIAKLQAEIAKMNEEVTDNG